MKNNTSTNHISLKAKAFCLLCLGICATTFVSGQGSTSLYVSKQTGQFSSYTGSGSKTTDKFEHGTVSVTVSGPIQYSVTPNEFSIGPNETKTWTGNVTPDVNSSPDAGNSTPASLNAHYDVHFKKGGIYDVNTGTWVQEGYATDQSGDVPVNFTVISIKVSAPDTICVGSDMTATATAIPYPDNESGATYSWSVLSGNSVTLTNTTAQTVNITLTDTNSVTPIKVIYNIQGVTYSAITMVKYCRCRCSNITTGMTFGPIAATFTAPPASSAPDGAGFCSYNASNASFALTMNGVVQKQVNITNANITFKRNCQTGDWKDVSITWAGNQAIGDISFLSLNLTALSLQVATNGNLSGSVTMNVSLNQDKPLMNGLVLLKQGVNGNVTFNFNNTNGWDGSFDFSGVHNINLDIVKGAQQTVIAQVQNGNLASDGSFTGTFTAIGGAQYTTDVFRITMNTLTLGVQLSMQNGINFTSGSGSVTVDQIAHTTGNFTLGLSFGSGSCNASISASSITAFSMTMSNLNLSADFNASFDMTQIRGSLDAKHDQFNASIKITEFEVKDGSLTKFNGSGKVSFRGFTFDLQQCNYAPGTLTITAKVEINVTVEASLTVTNMTITDAGIISVGGISGDFTRAPVNVSFKATMSNTRFTGTFNGSFTSITIAGMVDIGAMQGPDYNFAYLSLTAGTNIPLGQSGLKISQIGGQFGMNYQLNNPPQPGGNPSQGTYVVGLTLGIADMANMCELIGSTTAQFGNGNIQLSLSGTLNVLKTNPYFSGNMTINYMIPAQQISGSVSSVVNFPSGGWILQTNNATMNFSVANGNFTASGNNMTGKLFSHIDLTNGSISFNGSASNPLNFTGSIGGRASAGFNHTVSTSCGGFGLSGNMQMNMNSNVNAAINSNGLAGSFTAHVDGSGTITMVNPLYNIQASVSGAADGTISAGNGSASISGTMYVNLPFGLQPGINFNIGI